MLKTSGLHLAVEEIERSFQGIPITIENPKGSTRTGTDKKGEHWEREMQADYGYIPDTTSKGDHEDVDVYIGPDADAPTAFVIDQLKDDNSFDEAKIMLGFADEASARTTYLQHYPADWESHIRDIWAIPVSRLKALALADQTTDRSKTAAIPLEELRAAGERYMQQPRFLQAVENVAPGKSWYELTPQQQLAACREDQRLEFAEKNWDYPEQFIHRQEVVACSV